MKNNFLRILSPITIGVVLLLDAAVIGYTVFAIKKLGQEMSPKVIFFAVCVFASIIVGILVTVEIFKNGIKFESEQMEFTCADDNNIVRYDEIDSIETQKDTAPSFTKNFFDRRAKVIINKKSGDVMTIDIGLVTKGTLAKIKKEIEKRIISE